jgi:DNA repair protein RadC
MLYYNIYGIATALLSKKIVFSQTIKYNTNQMPKKKNPKPTLKLNFELSAKSKRTKILVETPTKVVEILEGMAELKRENFISMAFTNHSVLEAIETVAVGSRNIVLLSANSALGPAFRYECKLALTAHNHPDGFALPSWADIRGVYTSLCLGAEFGIVLENHVIITPTEAFIFSKDLPYWKELVDAVYTNRPLEEIVTKKFKKLSKKQLKEYREKLELNAEKGNRKIGDMDRNIMGEIERELRYLAENILDYKIKPWWEKEYKKLYGRKS